MAFRVKVLPRARQDLETIYRRNIQEAPLRAAEWFNRLESAISSLRDFPERCPPDLLSHYWPHSRNQSAMAPAKNQRGSKSWSNGGPGGLPHYLDLLSRRKYSATASA